MADHLPEHQSTRLECSAFQYRYHLTRSTQLPTSNRTKTENTTSSTTTLINHYSHVCIYTIRHMYDTLICCLHSQHMVGFRADCPPMAMR
uniref:Uncharacterized protein n=1 Tax=Glossina palpalis gambiensis TaxID=67801 RepID=A0A1B0BQF8_9MUSC